MRAMRQHPRHPAHRSDRSPLALVVAAAIVFIVAHTAPLMGLSAVGRSSATTIAGLPFPQRDVRVLTGALTRHLSASDC